MAQLNIEETRSWLDIVYSETSGFINICSTLNWAGKCFPTHDTEAALAYITQLDAAGAEGIYLRATTLREIPDSGRGGDDLSFQLPGLWADIDIAGPGHKTPQPLPPTIEEAMRIVTESGLPQPSHWIHSGGGLYPWWLLRNAIEIYDLEDFRALAGGWQKILEASAKKLGYHYGSGVGDLSRVLRIPGTVNRKAGLQRPCTELEGHAWDGPLYEAAELFEALATATPDPVPQEPSRLEVKLNRLPSHGTRPGDDFENKVQWRDLLVPLGWQWVYKRGDKWHLRRPGKTQGGTSATLSDITGNLYIFSEECQPLKSFEYYSKFAFYTVMEHGGDFRAATKELARIGYGTPLPNDDDARLVLDSARPLSATQAPIAIGEPLMEKVRRDKLGLPMYDDEEFGKDRWDHSGVAENWARIHSGTFAYIPSQKSWMMWQGDKWGTDESLRHERAVDVWCQRMREAGIRQGEGMEKEGKKLCTKAAQTSILGLAKSNPAISASLREFDKDPNLMTVGNGILNLQTGQLTRHDPELMLTRKVNANVDRSKKTGRWTQFMEEVLPDKEIREYLQRACGYALTGTLDERVIFLIHGESGTGKSQFLEAITTVLGDFAAIAPTSTFQPKKNGYDGPSADLHKLRGKRIVLQSELDAGSRLNESLVKSIVGGDTQTTRTLYSDFIEWKPEYTVFMATNFLPRISSTDNAIWARVKPIRFGQVFINSKGEGGERSLGKKMAQTEPEVILNWLLDGLDAYLERGLDEPEQVSAWTADYRDDVDTTRQFIAEAPEDGLIEVREGAQMKVRELYRTYAAWCSDNAITPVGTKNFTERMLSAGWKKEKRESGIMWQGVGIAAGEWLGAAQRPAVKTWERRK